MCHWSTFGLCCQFPLSTLATLITSTSGARDRAAALGCFGLFREEGGVGADVDPAPPAEGRELLARRQAGQLRVVIAADFSEGTKDGNCEPIDRFLWVDQQEGARMFIAAGLHPATRLTVAS